MFVEFSVAEILLVPLSCFELITPFGAQFLIKKQTQKILYIVIIFKSSTRKEEEKKKRGKRKAFFNS